MDINQNYLLLFGISHDEAHTFKTWDEFISKLTEKANKIKPKSTLAPASQTARYQALSDKIKQVKSEKDNGTKFSDFLESQRKDMLAIQADKSEEIKQILRFCDSEKLNSSDFVKKLCTDYAKFQITEDVILSLIKAVSTENESDDDFSDYLSHEDEAAISAALINASREDDSLYQLLNVQEDCSLEELQKQAGKYYEKARKSNDSVLSALFGQCIKVFKTVESRQKYDNYLKISKYKKINRSIEGPIRLTGDTSISEKTASKIITQAVKDYPELSRYKAAVYIKNYCGYRGYTVSISAAELIKTQETPTVNPEEETANKLLRNAEIMLNQPELSEKAREIFEKATQVSPDNYLGWFGIARSITENFTLFESKAKADASKYIKCALSVAGNKKSSIEASWNKYLADYSAYVKRLDSERKSLNAEISETAQLLNNQSAEKAQLQSDIYRLRKKGVSQKLRIFPMIIEVLCGAFIYFIADFLNGWTTTGIQEQGLTPDRQLELIVLKIMFFSAFVMFVLPIFSIIKHQFSKRNGKILQEKCAALSSLEKSISVNSGNLSKLREKMKYISNLLRMTR